MRTAAGCVRVCVCVTEGSKGVCEVEEALG